VSLPDDTSPRLADIDWRWALPRIALLFIATRLLVLAVALAVEVTESAQPAGASIDERPIITSLTGWDSTYFLGIAESGYHADPSYGPDYAFYPLYPVVIKVASLPTLGDTAVAAILAANGAFALALVALYALSVRYLTPARALLSLWFLALAPGAAAFTLAYADSLFLFLTVGVFLAAELRRPWIAGIALALATGRGEATDRTETERRSACEPDGGHVAARGPKPTEVAIRPRWGWCGSARARAGTPPPRASARAGAASIDGPSR
jgi:hypothetical protein